MIVIADDITGAAEIAGIAFEQGQQVQLVCGSACSCGTATNETTVIATDTRSMSEAEAIAETKRILLTLSPSHPLTLHSSLFTLHSLKRPTLPYVVMLLLNSQPYWRPQTTSVLSICLPTHRKDASSVMAFII